jgi:hypothetical protein
MIKAVCYIVGAILFFLGLEALTMAVSIPIVFAGTYYIISLLLFAGMVGIMYLGYTTTAPKHKTTLTN